MSELEDYKRKENPFKVPEGYFANNREKLLNQLADLENGPKQPMSKTLHQPNTSKLKIKSRTRKLYWIVGAAAAVGLMAMIWVNRLEPVNFEESWVADITSEEALQYALAHEEDFSPLLEGGLDIAYLDEEQIELHGEIDDQYLIEEVLKDIDLFDIQNF